MLWELIQPLTNWSFLDTWIVVTAALVAMSCALPGNYLLLRRQSLMGDALSHAVLPGIVGAFLLAHSVSAAGWMSTETWSAVQHGVMFAGAVAIGIASAFLTEWVQKLGQVEASAALGVVFTTLFALGLLLVRLFADNVHIDPDCVLYGTIETVVLDTVGTTDIPRAAAIGAGMLAINLLLLVLFYKELCISAFDPALATTLGIKARWMHYGLMAVTAATVVSAFESVGSILVIAMLIAPAATAYLLTDRLSKMIALSLVVACLTALAGHVSAITLVPVVFHRLGFPTVVDASTAGMMAVAAGGWFAIAMLIAPRHGIISRIRQQARLGVRIASEDLLGTLYRHEEHQSGGETSLPRQELLEQSRRGLGPWLLRIALARLVRRGRIASNGQGMQLTAAGRQQAERLIRAHRLWESYLQEHFALPDDHLHDPAERVEHFLDAGLTDELTVELNAPDVDPQGKAIPPDTGTES